MLSYKNNQAIQQLVLSSELCGVLPANQQHSFVGAEMSVEKCQTEGFDWKNFIRSFGLTKY